MTQPAGSTPGPATIEVIEGALPPGARWELTHEPNRLELDVIEGALPPGARWSPIVGGETLQVLERMSDLDDAGKTKVQNEGVSILVRCMPPDQPSAKTTGLVLGQV